jgi:hypothetical protein
MAKKRAVNPIKVVDHGDSGIKVFDYKGFRATQVVGVEKAFTALDETTKGAPFNLIIEIGTDQAGLTNLLVDHNISRTAEFHTFDINDKYKGNIPSKATFHNEDVFENETIKKLLNTKDRVLLLCDGGNKPREFNTFKHFLKRDDIIMAHDYVADNELFQKKFKGVVWNWHEFQNSDAADEKLEPFLQDVFAPYVWCIRIVK